MQNLVVQRVLGAARFDRESFLWMLWNDRAGGDAAILVLITQAALTLGLVGLDFGLALQLFISGLFFWLIYSGLTYAAAKYLFDGSGQFGGVMRIAGFAFPTTILVLAFRFLVGDARVAYLLSLVWFVAIVAHGLKEAMDLPMDKGWMSAGAGVLGFLVVSSVLGGI